MTPEKKEYLNRYECGSCGHTWDDIWTCACDDICSKCRTANGPFQSELWNVQPARSEAHDAFLDYPDLNENVFSRLYTGGRNLTYKPALHFKDKNRNFGWVYGFDPEEKTLLVVIVSGDDCVFSRYTFTREELDTWEAVLKPSRVQDLMDFIHHYSWAASNKAFAME